MAMSRSPRPASVVSYQNASPRLSSPLNPSPNTPGNLPDGEMSDTLSPLREHLPGDSGLTSPRPRASSFSRFTSPDRSPIVGSQAMPQHRGASARHPSPCRSPLAQGVPFPNSPTRSPPPGARPLSPANTPRQDSPASVHSCQIHPPCSPPRLAQSHFRPPQGSSPVQIMRARTQSFIHQSRGQSPSAASSPDDLRHRRVSLGAEPCPHPAMAGAGRGDSTPLNEAPIRWWGGSRGWADDWDSASQQRHQQMSDSNHSPGLESVCQNPSGRAAPGPGPFLDDEIRASFDPTISGPVSPLMPDVFHGTMGELEGFPVSRGVPVPMPLGSAISRMTGYGDINVGSPPADSTHVMRKVQENLAHHTSCHLHSHGNSETFSPDSAVPQDPGQGGHVQDPSGRCSRRFSDASTRSSASYASCLSGPSRSQSRTILVPSSRSHTTTSPSLLSLGIGIEEAEREELRSKTFWKRRNSGSTIKRQSKDLGRGVGGERNGGAQSPGLVRDNEECEKATRHGSIFSRGGSGSKQADESQETAQRDGYNRAEKYVSLAITSILSAATITSLSPVGEALVKTRASVKFLGHELAPVVKDTLVASSDILSLAPLPGLEEAAKALLSVWDACQRVDTNRLSCLRLAERCATLLYSVRLEIEEAGVETAIALDEPVERLCDALSQIQTFLEAQLHRPFLKRYVRREEIARELVACNEAITDAASKFSISIQIRTYHEVCTAAEESKRFAQGIHTLLSMNPQMIQRNYATLYSQTMQAWRQEAAVGFSSDNVLGLTTDEPPMGATGNTAANEKQPDNRCWTPPPAYGMSSLGLAMNKSFVGDPVSSVSSTVCSSEVATEPVVPVPPPTPILSKATLVAEEEVLEETTTTSVHTKTEVTETQHPTSPMHALAQMHWVQDSVDAAADEAALQGTLTGALNAHNDVEMVRCLQVGRGEIPEAAETLRRMLGAGATSEVEVGGKDQVASQGDKELHRKFMQSGIEAMTRLAKTGTEKEQDETEVLDAPPLPSWTITRYEVTRTRKIGVGLFSQVYLGHWQDRRVVIKVLAHDLSRDAFVRHVEMWKALDHPNVLLLHGASSAMGEKPWFFVSKFCRGGNLIAWLKRASAEANVLRCMHDVAKGMAYLHERGVLHGDLRAANVLVDEDGRCVLSDFGQCDIKAEVHRSCGQPERRKLQWEAPEILDGCDRPTKAADVYAFAMCFVEVLGMGEFSWSTLDDKVIRELVVDKDERPPIPALAGDEETANTVERLVRACWAREPGSRPSFANTAVALEDVIGHDGPSQMFRHPLTPQSHSGLGLTPSIESSPADDQYETASESMMTEIGEDVGGMSDIPLTSPAPPALCAGVLKTLTRLEEHSWMNELDAERRSEEIYRLVMGSKRAFHNSLTLALWSPTHVEVGAVGYLSKPKGEFVTLLNALGPLASCEEQLRRLPSMHGYGKFEVQKREDGKRNMAQRGLDAISGFLTFKPRGDRLHPERIARQYAFSLAEGKLAANLCVEKTVHQFMNCLDAPMAWFNQHVDDILEVYGSRYGIQKEDLILVVGTLDAPDWALFVSEHHLDGRAQFNVFAGREKGDVWGVYTMERMVKGPNASGRFVDVSPGQGGSKFVSKVSSSVIVAAPQGLQADVVVDDTVMLAGLRFEKGMEKPSMMM